MLATRSAFALARRVPLKPIATRSFTSSAVCRNDKHSKLGPRYVPKPGEEAKMTPFEDVKGEDDLLAPGAEPGTVPTDLEQATGLERLEILGKMQGIDIFDMKPLDASRLGTMENPIIVRSAGEEQYCGCTGFPADSHTTLWLTLSRKRPIERCNECGNVLKMEYVGPPVDPNDHHHGYEEPKTFADYVRPDYWYR